jgi:rSAM/selenodomain-associated transferase 1
MTVTRIFIIAKAPVAGFAKTRLIPALGTEAAAALARRMLLHALQQATAAAVGPVELCVTPAPPDPAWQGWLTVEGVQWSAQADGDLGARMSEPAQRAIILGERVLLVGTDCPQLDATRLRQAAAALEHFDVVLHPTVDGGYALLGLRRYDAYLFERMPWSTAEVAASTLQRIRKLGWRVAVAETLRDIDATADLPHLPAGWRRSGGPTVPCRYRDNSGSG